MIQAELLIWGLQKPRWIESCRDIPLPGKGRLSNDSQSESAVLDY
ncbi:uncharacterized protein METZ01_LOCUS203897, partial [marine metagenome]